MFSRKCRFKMQRNVEIETYTLSNKIDKMRSNTVRSIAFSVE